MWKETRERKKKHTQRAAHLHFHLPFKTARQRPTSQRKPRQPGGEISTEAEGDEEEVGRCEMDQTMDESKYGAVLNQVQANEKGRGGDAGDCDTSPIFK